MSELDLTGRTLGGYRVDGLVGRGAYGWVYRARQLSLDRAVALKVLDPVVARNPDAARRFEREGRSVAALDHPAIVDVHDASSAGGLHFLAMRLIDGIALDALLARRRLAPAEVTAVLGRIAAALDHAHAAGVVHRDVKPANILLQHADPARAWLGDFGIAVSVRGVTELSTATVGTAHYMAPEQLDPAKAGPRSDQYSLACVAYEALTGRRPFGADSDDVMAVLFAHRGDPVPPAGSPALDTVFATGLAKSPADRYPTAAAFVTALDSALRTPRPAQQPPARPPQPPRPAQQPPARTARRPRSRRLVAGGLALVAAAGATTAVLMLTADDRAAGGGVTRDGWTAVRGPGDVTYQVPPGWRHENAGSVVVFTTAGNQALLVGSEQVDADPAEDLRKLYKCTGPVGTDPVAGLAAAACEVGDQHVTVVAGEGTVVRFAFAGAVSTSDRDGVLKSLTISAS